MNDRLEVAEAMTRYAFALDEGDRGAYVALFTEEAELVYVDANGTETLRVRGRRAIGRVFDAQRAQRQGQTRHVASTPIVTSDGGDSLASRAPFVVTSIVDGAPTLVATGIYRDRWVRTRGGMKLAERSIVLDAPPTSSRDGGNVDRR